MVKTTDDIIKTLLKTSDSQKAVGDLDNLQIREVLKHLLVSVESMINKVPREEEVFTRNKGNSCAFDILFTKNVPHILEKIFLSLDYESYKKCLKVKNTWKDLLTSEAYQRKGKLVYHDDISNDAKKLWHDSQRGNTEKVRELLSTGMMDVNFWAGYVSRRFGETALLFHFSVVKIGGEESFHGSLKMRSRLYSSPLYEAADNGHGAVVELLLEGGALPDMFMSGGCTPLIVASENGHKDVVKILLNGGANSNAWSISFCENHYAYHLATLTKLSVARR